MFTSFAPAKINLFLLVIGQRPDGYHLLDSVAVFAGAGDVVSAAPADELTLTITGPFAGGLTADQDNLVLQAAQALANAAGIPARAALTLEKNLPVASGIGGGSADAAAALRVLAQLWALKPPLAKLAAPLGADVPVCMASKPARMGGIGEILTAAPELPKFGLVLINPGVAVATPDVFRARTGRFSMRAALPAGWRQVKFMASDLAELSNDLEEPAIKVAPVIGTVLRTLQADRKCLLARMSGSGATCFGIYETPTIAKEAAEAIRRKDWWIWSGGLAEAAPTDI
jgi:4-diphosphocytidyl-2-C-methyl-D-erythritol kinase